jgi:hypothetical protein
VGTAASSHAAPRSKCGAHSLCGSARCETSIRIPSGRTEPSQQRKENGPGGVRGHVQRRLPRGRTFRGQPESGLATFIGNYSPAAAFVTARRYFTGALRCIVVNQMPSGDTRAAPV